MESLVEARRWGHSPTKVDGRVSKHDCYDVPKKGFSSPKKQKGYKPKRVTL